jgi:hypothetical protein
MRRTVFRSAVSGFFALLLAGVTGPTAAAANRPGGGTGEGPDVTLTDNGDGTVTVANGIVSIVIVKTTSRLNAVTAGGPDAAGQGAVLLRRVHARHRGLRVLPGN